MITESKTSLSKKNSSVLFPQVYLQFQLGKRQTSVKRDPMGDMVAKIFDLREEISKMISEFLQKKQEIVRTIEQVEDPLLYNILFKHYVEYKSLVRIADEMGYSEIHIKKKHLKALAEVKKIKGFER